MDLANIWTLKQTRSDQYLHRHSDQHHQHFLLQLHHMLQNALNSIINYSKTSKLYDGNHIITNNYCQIRTAFLWHLMYYSLVTWLLFLFCSPKQKKEDNADHVAKIVFHFLDKCDLRSSVASSMAAVNSSISSFCW